LQTDAEDHAKCVVTGIAPAYLLRAMKINPLPARKFVVDNVEKWAKVIRDANIKPE
jgi:hypothetical protein